MAESFQVFTKYCDSAEKTFDSRLNLLADYDDACKNTLKKKQAAEKAKSSSQTRVDKVEGAVAELQEAEKTEKELKEQFLTVSTAIQEFEWPTFLKCCNQDIYSILSTYARSQMEIEGRILNEFSSIFADMDLIQAAANIGANSGAPAQLVNEKIAAEVL
jgi:hypothetical protein